MQSGKVEPKPFVLQQGKGLHFFYNDIFIQLYLYCHTLSLSQVANRAFENAEAPSLRSTSIPKSLYSHLREPAGSGSGEWRLEEEEWK